MKFKHPYILFVLGFAACLAIAAFPPQWNDGQFRSAGGYFSHLPGGNLGTNMTLRGQTILTNDDAGGTVLAFRPGQMAIAPFNNNTLLLRDDGAETTFIRAGANGITNHVATTFEATSTHSGGIELPADRNLNIGNQTVMNTGSGSAASTTWTGEGNVTINTETFTVSSPATFNSTVSISTNLLGQSFNIQTTDGSTMTIATFTIPSDAGLSFEATIFGLQDNGDLGAGYRVTGCGKNDGGTTAVIGSITTTVLGEDNAGFNAGAAFNDGSDTLTITVVGLAATTMNWSASVAITWVRNP